MTHKATDEEIEDVFKLYKEKTELEPGTGQLFYEGIPIMWSRVELIFNLQTEMMKLIGDAAFELMKTISFKHGSAFLTTMKSLLPSMGEEATKERLLRYLCKETPAVGWGRIEIEETEIGYVITAPSGLPVGRLAAEDERDFNLGVDSYFLGYFAGYLSAMDERTFIGSEVKCVGKGDDVCKMVF